MHVCTCTATPFVNIGEEKQRESSPKCMARIRVSRETEVDGGNSFSCSNENLGVSTDGNFVSLVSTAETPGQSSRSSEPRESMLDNSQVFYQKLSQFHESSGLSLVVNVRETVLDLHLFYKEVTTRGGFQQVTKDGRWDEVESALNLKRSVPNFYLRLQELYANLLYQFEQIYFYRTQPAAAPGPLMRKISMCDSGIGDNSTGKRKQENTFCRLSTDPSSIRNFPPRKRKRQNKFCRMSTGKCSSLLEWKHYFDPGNQIGKTVKGVIETEFDSGYLVKVMVGPEKLNGLLYHAEECAGKQFAVVPSLMDGIGWDNSDSEPMGLQIQVGTGTNQRPFVQTSSKNKEMKKKDPYAPQKQRSAYQIFLKKECDRLKNMHGGNVGHSIRKMAIAAWNCLSESDRQPYIKESQKDKERYNQEMVAYKERRNIQIDMTENRPYNPEAGADDYHVSLQTDGETNKLLVPDETMVELAVRLMEKAQPDDPILQINWDDFCGSLDIPT
ncbi:hypothetical protein HHK36_012237 [Tetracentron sinense]|uniref:Uncharacterized protein n=1 Tax=Tetracentron sinense TaxID=13715 RepID=A0A834Z4F2_TETSI|nr:hypothetical protein HHK36_012237 [Tetracentron sinense]